jgi:hypothetical protein
MVLRTRSSFRVHLVLVAWLATTTWTMDGFIPLLHGPRSASTARTWLGRITCCSRGTTVSKRTVTTDFTDQGAVRAAGLSSWAWWDSYVGNILGNPNSTAANGWVITDLPMSCDATGNNGTGNNANWNNGGSASDIWELLR